MTGLKPIKKPVAKQWYFVKFSYEHLTKVPRYDAGSDTIVMEDVRVGPVELVANQLAPNGAAASKIIREGAAICVRPGTLDAQGRRIEHVPIEGTVIILGVEPWVPKMMEEKVGAW